MVEYFWNKDAGDGMPELSSLDHLVLTVRDLAATLQFYSNALGMQVQEFRSADGSVRWALMFGVQKINLHVAGAEFEPKAALAVPGSADLCFLTEASLACWQAHLAAAGVAVIAGPVARTGATGPIRSLYIRDPDGNLVEISVPA